MTNYEYFKDEIIEIITGPYDDSGSIALIDEKPVICNFHTPCEECEFSDTKHPKKPGETCTNRRKAWLNAEHIEKPKLTKKERQFCELVETGWIARDRNGDLDYRTGDNKPVKRIYDWIGSHNAFCNYLSNWPIDLNFSFITWDDKEPWSVEELLKLEVED